MMNRKLPSAFVTLLLASFLLAYPAGQAQAHHSFAMFDRDKTVTVSGTVKEFQFTNPHCWIQLLVAGGATPVEWSIEMAAPAHLINAGWNKRTLKPGDKITVTMRPLRDGKNGGSFMSATDQNGHTI